MRCQPTSAIQSGLNKQRSLGRVFGSTLSALLMLTLCNTADAAWMGVAIECGLSDERIKRGVKVIGVDAHGPGARAGLRVGDLMVLVNGETVETCSFLAKIVREALEGTCLKLIIWRKSEWVSIQLILAKTPQHFILDQQGLERAEEGNYQEAIHYFTKAINFAPNYAEAYYNRGIAYFRKGQFDQAISDFNKALEINPNDAKAYVNRGIAFCKKSIFDQAISDFNKALEINPNDARAYYYRGTAYEDNGQHVKAIPDFRKAFKIDPRYAGPYIDREMVHYEAQGQYRHAISDYTKTLEINPNDAEAYYNRGTAHYHTEEYDKSWRDVYRAQDLGYKIPAKFLDKLRKASGKQN